MIALNSFALALWQTPDEGLPSRDEHWLMICIAVIALAMLLNAVITLVAGLAAKKAFKEITALVHDLHSKASPILQKTTEVIQDVSPKIRTVTENATQISYTVRAKVEEVGQTVTALNRTIGETNSKTRAQVDHVDRMVSTALDTAEQVTSTVTHGIRAPIKQVAGVIAGLRTGFETLLKNFGYGEERGGPDARF